MRKHILIFAIIFLSLLAFTIWQAQPPFRLQRKLLANLPYVPPDKLLITDLDDDGHPEVTAVARDNPPIWVRSPFDKPSHLCFENCQAVWGSCHSVLKSLPVLMEDNRLRLLRWKGEKARLDPLPSLPDLPVDEAWVYEGEDTGTVFLQVYQGDDVWLFTLTPKGEWKFASRFAGQRIEFHKFGVWNIDDLADFDRDGFLDALCLRVVFWGGRKEGETDLDVWMRHGYPGVSDLDGDGWTEIVMMDKDERLKIWRFDQRERRLKVIAASSPLPVTWSASFPFDSFPFDVRLTLAASRPFNLFDLDGDGREEIVITDASGNYWVFQWQDGRLKMWKGRIRVQDVGFLGQVRLDHWLALWGYQSRFVWLFLPRIWLEDGKVRWLFRESVGFTVFCLLPKGKQALSPSNWRFQEAPFYLEFAGDIDGDGSDELIGYDGRWDRYRLYRAELTKSGKLRWRDVLLGREELIPKVFALLVDGKRRGLVVWWSDGRLELLTMKGRR
jgi:hypothetical protein